MYVCVCNRVTEEALQQAVAEGAHSVKALQRALNLGTNCGSCLPMAASMLTRNLKTLTEQNPDLYYAA